MNAKHFKDMFFHPL
ncbi:hypothetical protein CAEBREN_02885 [Caenorhabditis brenneri]|uniref:Uncharacterized protein n=1 Tax=Caenorhabditis brenneri TaxID=135651 RepID=G0MID8_CAEBE|nr:hypothetical protein CAEBREN_02885 [Caenorhabditis brenneri]